MDKPEALFHIDWLSRSSVIGAKEAAAELRRLYKVNQELAEALHTAEAQIRVLAPVGYIPPGLGKIHAALAKHKEQS